MVSTLKHDLANIDLYGVVRGQNWLANMKQWWPWLKMRWAQTRTKRLMFQTVLVWRDLKKNLVAGGKKTGCMRLIPILPGVTFFRSLPRRQRHLVRYMSDTSFRIPKPT